MVPLLVPPFVSLSVRPPALLALSVHLAGVLKLGASSDEMNDDSPAVFPPMHPLSEHTWFWSAGSSDAFDLDDTDPFRCSDIIEPYIFFLRAVTRSKSRVSDLRCRSK